MNFSKPLVVLAILGLSTPALATNPIRSTKSNGSLRVTVCHDLACCRANPGANTPSGAPCSSVIAKSKNSAHATEKSTTINGSKSNSFKEAEPTPTPAPDKKSQGKEGSVEKTTVNSTVIHNYKETEPTPIIKGTKSNTSDRFGVGDNSEKTGRDKLKGSTKEAEPTPTPKPVGNKNLNSNRSN